MNHTGVSSPFQWYAHKPASPKKEEGGQEGEEGEEQEKEEKRKKASPGHVALADFHVVHAPTKAGFQPATGSH